jgi:hypothetical protein
MEGKAALYGLLDKTESIYLACFDPLCKPKLMINPALSCSIRLVGQR